MCAYAGLLGLMLQAAAVWMDAFMTRIFLKMYISHRQQHTAYAAGERSQQQKGDSLQLLVYAALETQGLTPTTRTWRERLLYFFQKNPRSPNLRDICQGILHKSRFICPATQSPEEQSLHQIKRWETGTGWRRIQQTPAPPTYLEPHSTCTDLRTLKHISAFPYIEQALEPIHICISITRTSFEMTSQLLN